MYNGTNFHTIMYYWLQISVENMESILEGAGCNLELFNNKVTSQIVTDGDKQQKRHRDRLNVQFNRMNEPQGQSNLPHAVKAMSLFMNT